MGRKHCGKGEIARQFLLFQQCFQKASKNEGLFGKGLTMFQCQALVWIPARSSSPVYNGRYFDKDVEKGKGRFMITEAIDRFSTDL